MRPLLLCLFVVFAAAPARAGLPPTPPPSAANLVRLHPGPWSFPTAPVIAGIRFEPETGEAAPELTNPGAKQPGNFTRARAEASVRTLPDGSRHAVLNGAIRSWAVATLDEQGRLTQDCVHSEAEARQRVEAAKAQVRK